MKLRIQSNSIRIRLTRSEVAELAAGKTIVQTTSFSPTARLVSSIETSSQSTAPTANFDAPRLAIVVPYEVARQWSASDEISIQAEQAIDSQRSLSLLIEKDFECLHHREENRDAFPNPRKPIAE